MTNEEKLKAADKAFVLFARRITWVRLRTVLSDVDIGVAKDEPRQVKSRELREVRSLGPIGQSSYHGSMNETHTGPKASQHTRFGALTGHTRVSRASNKGDAVEKTGNKRKRLVRAAVNMTVVSGNRHEIDELRE